MSNPNINALLSMIRNSAVTPNATAAGFKTVYVGHDRLPMSILTIDPLMDPTWRRSACFDSLERDGKSSGGFYCLVPYPYRGYRISYEYDHRLC